MYRAMLFAGTTEGRELAEYLADCGVDTVVSVATDYGQTLIEPRQNLTVHAGRLDVGEMEQFLRAGRFDFVVDATHPYAAQVTQNIRAACQQVQLPCYRCLREASQTQEEGILRVADTHEAVEKLNCIPGNILLTTGSKELAAYTEVEGFAQRVFPRVLPLAKVVESCLALGVPAGHLIAMQGPFSKELNLAMIRQWDIRCLVSKESGKVGGEDEKLAAAREAGILTLLIGRPPEAQDAMSLPQLQRMLCEQWKIAPPQGQPSQTQSADLPHFPLFVPLRDRQVRVFGAGKIAARRIRTLLCFGPQILVIAPKLDESLQELLEQKKIRWEQRCWRPGDCAGEMNLAATDDPQINAQIVAECRRKGIPSNRCDCREDCDFYFPAVVQADGLTFGLCSDGSDHRKVKRAAAWLREMVRQHGERE